MEVIADLHVHSRYARACSSQLSIPNLEKYGRMKGLGLLGTGDFQHPLHRKHIDENLTEDENGILWTKNKFPFIWQTEISFMYSQEKRRAVHLVVFAPSRKVVDEITKFLSARGRLDYDGRPIFGMSVEDFTREMKEISEDIEIIPAHCMTPWFGIFGSKSGFDSLKDAFGKEIKHIYAVESGLSADPPMLWRFQENFNIVSFSDAHSFWPWRLGREATIFELDKLTYKNIITAIRKNFIKATIETPPEYGKYHWDGHRNCNFSCSPETTKKLSGICPKCSKPMTIGVDYRVEEIAKFEKGIKKENSKPFYEIIPLHDLIALHLNSSVNSKKTWKVYDELIEKFGNEFEILLRASKEKLTSFDSKLGELIFWNREGKIKVVPGFDGEYGKPLLPNFQKTLF